MIVAVVWREKQAQMRGCLVQGHRVHWGLNPGSNDWSLPTRIKDVQSGYQLCP